MGILPDFSPGGTPADKGLSAMEMIDKAESGELKALLMYRSNPVVDFPGGKRVEAVA